MQARGTNTATNPDAPDVEMLRLLEDALRKTMQSVSGADLDAALVDLGWHDMLDEMPTTAIS